MYCCMYLCGNSVGVVDDPDGDVVVSQRNGRRHHVAPPCLCVLAVEVDAVYNRLSYTHACTEQNNVRKSNQVASRKRYICMRPNAQK